MFSTHLRDMKISGFCICTNSFLNVILREQQHTLAFQPALEEDSRASRPHSGLSSGSSRSAETQGFPVVHSLWHKDGSEQQTGAPNLREKLITK